MKTSLLGPPQTILDPPLVVSGPHRRPRGAVTTNSKTTGQSRLHQLLVDVLLVCVLVCVCVCVCVCVFELILGVHMV